MKTSILAVISLLHFSLFCQVIPNKVTFDLVKKEIPNEIPFDTYFTVEFIVNKGELPKKCFFYEAKTKNGETELIGYTTNKPLQKKELEKVSDTKFSTIAEPLDPNKFFDIMVTFNFNEKDRVEILEIIKAMHNPAIPNITKTAQMFHKLDERLSKSPYKIKSSSFNVNIHSMIGLKQVNGMVDLYQFYLTHFLPKLNGIFARIFNSGYSPISNTNYNALLTDLKKYFDDIEIMSSYGSILNSRYVSEVLSGTLSLKNLFESKPKDKYDFVSRIANLKESIEIVQKQLSLVELVSSTNENHKAYLTNLLSLLRELQTNHKFLTDEYKALIKVITDYDFSSPVKNNRIFGYSKWVSSSTLQKEGTIKTKYAKHFIADFGMVHIAADSRIHGITYIPRPYIGINFTRRKIEKNKDIREGSKISGWYRWSISAGVTIGGIDRFDFSDFYDNMSLMLGANYRIHEQIRIGGGIAFLRETHPNPTIDNPRLESGLYLSTTLDFEVLDFFPKLIGKIFN